jgi:hypothetical protein
MYIYLYVCILFDVKNGHNVVTELYLKEALSELLKLE